MYPVTEKEVTEIMSGCKSQTSYGHDEISMKTVKHVIKQIVRPLTYIFNRSLITGIFPGDMKKQTLFLFLNQEIVSNF